MGLARAFFLASLLLAPFSTRSIANGIAEEVRDKPSAHVEEERKYFGSGGFATGGITLCATKLVCEDGSRPWFLNFTYLNYGNEKSGRGQEQPIKPEEAVFQYLDHFIADETRIADVTDVEIDMRIDPQIWAEFVRFFSSFLKGKRGFVQPDHSVRDAVMSFPRTCSAAKVLSERMADKLHRHLFDITTNSGDGVRFKREYYGRSTWVEMADKPNCGLEMDTVRLSIRLKK